MKSYEDSGLVGCILKTCCAMIPVKGQMDSMNAGSNLYEKLLFGSLITAMQIPYWSVNTLWLQSNCSETYGSIVKYSELFI